MAIHKSAKGYTVEWYDADGRRRQKTYKGIDKDRALKLERELLAARDRGERPIDERDVPTFDTYATTWVEECRARWKPATRQQYEQALKSQLRPRFGDLRISAITDSLGRRLVTDLVDRKLSARRINLVLLVLKMILKHARRQRWLRDDPIAEVSMLPELPVEIDPLSPDEIETFLATCPRWWRPYFTVAFWTGARPNELGALKWGDVDGPSARFRIRAGRYRGHESTPKTPSSVRDVDCLAPVVEALKAQKAQQSAARLKAGQGAPAPGEDYVFTGPEGGLLNVNNLRDHAWYGTLAKAQLRRRTMYQTRHSFASNALAAGEDPSWIAQQLGHTSTEMLFKVYARFIPNRTRRDGSALLARMGARERTLAPVEVAGRVLRPSTGPPLR